MLFLNRAASYAVASLAAAVLACTTTPGLAEELRAPSIATTTFNALTMPAVPTAAAPVLPLPQPMVSFAAAQEVVQPLPQSAAVPADDQADDQSDDQAGSGPYESLAHAVASQDAAEMDRELTCLASGVYFESKGEPLAGQLAVAETIINRTKSGRFAKSICGVLTQRGQFSFIRGGNVPTAEGRKGWATAVAVAKVAVRDLWDSPATGALFFHARRVGNQGWRATRIASIGNHIFYR